MKFLEKLSDWVSKYLAIIMIVCAALALFVPSSATWIKTSWINPFLMVIMFGMGLTIRLEDFRVVFTHPKEVIIGCISQFTIMPLIAFALGKVFGLEIGLLTGVILVGTCPGGTSSNVLTYIGGGDTALSVGMTCVNTILAPIITPAITYLLLRTQVHVDVLGMFLSILQVVIIPIALGFIINKGFSKYTAKASKILPLVSSIAIIAIVMGIVANNSAQIRATALTVFVVVILHNFLGCGCGFAIAKAFKMSQEKCTALSIEVGVQNSGLATSLAKTSFPDLSMATVPGAIFSAWNVIGGAILASVLRRLKNDKR